MSPVVLVFELVTFLLFGSGYMPVMVATVSGFCLAIMSSNPSADATVGERVCLGPSRQFSGCLGLWLHWLGWSKVSLLWCGS